MGTDFLTVCFSALYYNYTYDASAGTGVDIYIVDTGIYVNHVRAASLRLQPAY